MNTLQKITETLINIAERHPAIQKAMAGDIYQKEAFLADEYPLVFFDIQPSEVQNNAITLKYTMIIAEMVDQTQGNNDSNIIQVSSDMLSNGLNIMSEIKNNLDYKFMFNETYQVAPFYSGFLSNAVGWMFDIEITTPVDVCSNPIQ